MSLTAQNLRSSPNPSFTIFSQKNTSRIQNSLNTHYTPLSISLKGSTFSPLFVSLPTFFHKGSYTRCCSVRDFADEGALSPKNDESYVNLDTLLPILEFLCIASSAVVSIGLVFNKAVITRFGNIVFGWQLGFLVGAVAIGAVIRERQWRRVCTFSRRGSEKVNLVERMERLEEDVRSSATIVRVLSRQLEKLGVRFRVTRKTLQDPIAEASALAQKNSEATRALAAQEENLEKELSEIQKVLLAMQEQQQKQLKLILAIAETGKLLENRRGPSQEQQQKTSETRKLTKEQPNQMTKSHFQALNLQKESNDDKA